MNDVVIIRDPNIRIRGEHQVGLVVGHGHSDATLQKTKQVILVFWEFEWEILTFYDIGHFTEWTYFLKQKSDAKPLFINPFPIPELLQRSVVDWTEKMLRSRIIERAPKFLRNSPIFFVSKNDVSGRVLCDMRGPNNLIGDEFLPSKSIDHPIKAMWQINPGISQS